MMEDPASMTTEAETEAEASVLASTAVDTKVIFCTSRTFACSVSEFSSTQNLHTATFATNHHLA